MRKEILRSLKTGSQLIKFGSYFWLLETVYFLIDEGWHWKATSDAEIVCDGIVSILWVAGLCNIGYAFYKGIKLIAERY